VPFRVPTRPERSRISRGRGRLRLDSARLGPVWYSTVLHVHSVRFHTSVYRSIFHFNTRTLPLPPARGVAWRRLARDARHVTRDTCVLQFRVRLTLVFVFIV